MIKRALLSFGAGAFLAILVLAAPSAKAACDGYCADRIIRDGCHLDYSGCAMYYDAQGNLENVDCFYSGADSNGCIIN